MGKKRKSKGKASKRRSLADQLAGVKASAPAPARVQEEAEEAPGQRALTPAEAAQDDDALLALWGDGASSTGAQTTTKTLPPVQALPKRPVPQKPPIPHKKAASAKKAKASQPARVESPQVPGLRQEGSASAPKDEVLAGLREEVAALSSALARAEQQLEKERARSERFLEEREAARAAQAEAEGAFEAASDALAHRGIPTHLYGDVLAAMASGAGETLLPLLGVSSEPFRRLLAELVALSCGHEECEEELRQSSSRQILQVEEARACENCQGSDNRRAFRRMVRMCREKRRYKMIVVGGSPDAHTELAQLTPEGFIQRIVTGKERRTKREATEDLRHADLLAVWGPTILPHKISELYTKQKDEHPDKVVLVLKRGVASFAREICAFLERLD